MDPRRGAIRESIIKFYSDEELFERGLLGPRKKNINQRARFYFTEKGWQEIGRYLFSDAKRRGLNPRIIRRKNPKRSAVVYADSYQVALLH